VTPSQLALVHESFDAAFPVYDRLVAAFYDRLFEIAPALRPLFRHDLGPQREKFQQMLAAAVGLLDQPVLLRSVVYDLGLRHAGYGVTLAHFEPVARALIESLESGLGPRFTPAMRAAWETLLDEVRATMGEAMAAAA